jgi:hypothetical protein
MAAIHLGEDVALLVKAAAEFETLSISSYVRRAVVERLRRDGYVRPDEAEHPSQAVETRKYRRR